MNSILEQLYNGEILPMERYTLKEKEYKKICREHLDRYEDFRETLGKLNPPFDKQFIQIMDEQLDEIPYEFSQTFIDGFRLGARIMTEVFIRA